jgi:hypothetical protein
MSHAHKILGVTGLLAVLTMTAACDSSTSRQSARAQATSLTCQRYDMCMLIGPGKMYADHEACEIAWQAAWDGQWPAASCDGKINQGQYETCLAAIRGTSCNLGDLLLTLGKCDKANVCQTTSTPDGG